MDDKKQKKEILEREYKKYFEKKVMLEFEIALQRKLDPNEKSAKKPRQYASNGSIMSYDEITRKEYIEIKEDLLEDINVKLETIKELL